MSLPPYIDRAAVLQRLQVIFPPGVPQRNYCVREVAASTVFTMLYVGAVEGADQWIGPKHVVRMTDVLAARKDDVERLSYSMLSMKRGVRLPGEPWYADNSREQIRDETIRYGLITNNAVVERRGIPTTSPKPRYALRAEFAALFEPALDASAVEEAAERWRQKYLSPTALARTLLLRRGAVTTDDRILVTFPNRETRSMSPGPSSILSKAVIEEFAPRFLVAPAVLWLSESGARVVSRDDERAAELGLQIAPDRNLPDIILVDLGGGDPGRVLLVFIEVVATDGPVTAARRQALLRIATDARFPESRVAFVTAYLDRSDAAFKKTVAELSWNSFAWFAAEPEHIVFLRDGASVTISLETFLSLDKTS